MEKVRVVVPPDEDGVVPSQEELVALATAAGWTDSPLDGKSIRYKGGEIFNPLPVAPPIGYVPRDPLEDRLHRMIKSHLLEGQEQIEESAADVLDFEVDEDLPDLTTIYEFAGMQDEMPAPPPKEVSAEDRAMAEVEYEALKEKARKRRVREEAARRALLDDTGPGDDGPQGVRTDPVV